MQLFTVAVVVLFKGLMSVGQETTLQDLSSCQQSGILFFDNFETSRSIRRSLWNKSSGVDVKKTCSSGELGGAARFGSGQGTSKDRELVTVPINTTLAKVFAFDAAWCQNSGIISGSVSYTLSDGTTIHATDFNIPVDDSRRMVVMITEAMRGEGVRFSVKQTHSGSSGDAWTADNFAVFSGDYDVEQLSEDFDPMQNCTWIEKSGATVTRYGSHGHSLVFNFGREKSRDVVTRPIFLPGLLPDASEKSTIDTHRTILFNENFKANESIPNDRWRSISGGSVTTSDCGINSKNGSILAAFFNGSEERSIESRRFDLTSALVMSFFVGIGGDGCGAAKSGQDVLLQYSPDGSTDFTDLRLLTYKDYKSPKCVLVHLPEGARTLATALRWRQQNHSGEGTAEWAIDKIRIADRAGREQLISECSHEGKTLYISDFGNDTDVRGGMWDEMSGGAITVPDCGSIDLPGSSPQAAFFNKSGTRSIQTQPLDLRRAKTLSFRVRIGGGDGCESADSGGDVTVAYSIRDTSDWQLIWLVNASSYVSAKSVSVTLPAAARTEATVIRWYQVLPSGYGYAEWALDQVRIVASPISQSEGNTLYSEDFSPSISIPNELWAASAGAEFRMPDCGSIDLPRNRSTAAFFTLSRDRFIQTQALNLRFAHRLSFRVQIGGESGCETADVGDDVVVEYKTMNQSEFTRIGLLLPKGHEQAKEKRFRLPEGAKSPATVLRWKQLVNSGVGYDEWAIDRIRVTSNLSEVLFEDDFNPIPMIPGPKWAAIAGGSIDTPECGHIDNARSPEAVYFNRTGSRFLQTQSLNLTDALSVIFQIKIGGDGGCEPADTGDDVVLEYKTSKSMDFTTLQLMAYNQFKTSKTVSVSLPLEARTASTVLRWKQLDNSGNGYDEWAIDSIRITDSVTFAVSDMIGNILVERFDSRFSTPYAVWQSLVGGSVMVPPCGSISVPRESDTALYFSLSGSRYIVSKRLDLTTARVLSFRIRIGGGGGCETAEASDGVVLEFAPLGTVVHTLIATYQPSAYSTARTVSLNLPVAAKTAGTLLRWRQLRNSGSNYDVWMLDDIVLALETSVIQNAYNDRRPIERALAFSEDFDTAPDFPGGDWLSISGGSIATPDCGGIDVIGYSTQAAFFSQAGQRSITTQPLDLENAGDLSFRIVIGGLSGCENADTGEDVVVEYKVSDNSTFYELVRLNYDGHRIPTTIMIPLPKAVRTQQTALRWRQLKNDGKNYDEWAIDHVRITSTYIRTHVVEFDMCMTCGATYTNGTDSSSSAVDLQFSNNYGRRWQPVHLQCWPTDPGCVQSLFRSSYSPILFNTWRRITLILPSNALGRFTQFRWKQTRVIAWAIDNVYIGVQCPNFCSGHGRCVTPSGDKVGRVCGGSGHGQRCSFPFVFNNRVYNKCTREGREGLDNELWCATTSNYDQDRLWGFCTCGVCMCYPGYSGESCDTVISGKPTAAPFKEEFEKSLDQGKWSLIVGGSVGNGCGVLSSGQTMVFSFGKTRVLETVDLYVPLNSTLEFSVSGSSLTPLCPLTALNSHVGVFVQYSVNGGATWYLLEQIRPPTTFRTIVLPLQAETKATRFRWYQPAARGDGLDKWAIDDVTVQTRSPIKSYPITDDFDNTISGTIWRRHLQSQSERYCGSLSVVRHFQSTTYSLSRTILTYLTTNFVMLLPDSFIQFDLLVTCGQPFDMRKSVTLKYSRIGTSFSYVSYGCSPSSVSSGRCSPSRSTRYYSGLYSSWRRVTIPLNTTSLVLPATVRLQWYGQLQVPSNSSSHWAIDNVYIGKGCPRMCNGHGRCNSINQCVCDEGFSGVDCSVSSRPLARELKEKFFNGSLYTINTTWAVVSGGNVTSACGELTLGVPSTMVFDKSGERELVTMDMDTTNVAVISFVFLATSKKRNQPCSSSGSVYVLLDYSNNGGVSWSPLLLLRNTRSRNALFKRVGVPEEARTSATRFRWWQSGPLSENYGVWAITDIFIGAETVCQNGGTLNPDDASTAFCECPPGFKCDLCQCPDLCNPNPCKNGGLCQSEDEEPFTFTCLCPPEFSGQNCTDRNYCLGSNPCGKNGYCLEDVNIIEGYTCKCSHGYTGKQCNMPMDNICSQYTICANGGTCVSANTNHSLFHCICPHGYSGLDCREVGNIALKSHASSDSGVPPWAWIVFVTGLVIVIAIVGAAIILRGRKHSYNVSKSSTYAEPTASYHVDGSGGDIVAFDNPAAEYTNDTVILATSTAEEKTKA